MVLIGLPIGGGATPTSVAVETVSDGYVPIETEFTEPMWAVEPDHALLDPANAAPLQRPTNLATDAESLHLIGSNTRFSLFITPQSANFSAEPAEELDPRLQRKGHDWALSNAFAAKVGADPWALDGVGFPNVETHGPDVENQYKPFRALIDWSLVNAERGEWKPIPAVYCMGLSAQQIAERAETHERQILAYAIQFGVSASLVKAVITKESCFNTKAVSRVGAEGLMQLMPETARWLKVTDRNDVNQNLAAGIRYLADLRKRFGSEELALAAYNAGPGNVERHGGIPPFKETQQYVVSVMAHYRSYAATTRFANRRVSN